MRYQWQVLEYFWKYDQKSTLIAGFWTHNEHGMSGGSKPVHIGDLRMGLISCLQQSSAKTPKLTCQLARMSCHKTGGKSGTPRWDSRLWRAHLMLMVYMFCRR